MKSMGRANAFKLIVAIVITEGVVREGVQAGSVAAGTLPSLGKLCHIS